MTGDPSDREWTRLLHEYRTPPETPREAIWNGIEARRAAARARRGFPLRPRATWWWVTGIAAALLIGIGLGTRMGPGSGGTVYAPSPAATQAVLGQATVQHLSRVESFLTGYRLQAPEAGEFRPTARDLLTSTRLLLDSPGIQDPRTRALLSDLEFILAQILQSSPGDTLDRELIQDGLTSRHVVPRLQAVIPAGLPIRFTGAS